MDNRTIPCGERQRACRASHLQHAGLRGRHTDCAPRRGAHAGSCLQGSRTEVSAWTHAASLPSTAMFADGPSCEVRKEIRPRSVGGCTFGMLPSCTHRAAGGAGGPVLVALQRLLVPGRLHVIGVRVFAPHRKVEKVGKCQPAFDTEPFESAAKHTSDTMPLIASERCDVCQCRVQTTATAHTHQMTYGSIS